jgi:hypothetical protein
MSRITLPFKIKNVFEGFAEVQGILTYDGEILNIEFQTKDSLLGVIESGIKDISIPKSEIEEIDFKKSLFGCSLIIRVARMQSVEGIPKQQEAGEIKLSIARKHTDLTLDLVSQIDLES